MESNGFTGGCLCGAVTYTSSELPIATIHCCCVDCRKLGGTGHSTHSPVHDEAFSLKGEVREYSKTADSGNRIHRFFCPVCACPIYHRRDGLEGLTVIRTSSMDDPELAKPDRVIYTSSKVSWDDIDPQLPQWEFMSPAQKKPK